MTPARVLVVFAFFVGALDLGWSRGLVGAVVSPAGILLLAIAGLLLAWRAVAAVRAPGPAGERIARVLLSAGSALFLVGVPASFATRDTVPLAVGEGEPVPAGRLAGMPTIRFGEVRVEPRGPGILSKTVSIAARAEGHAPVEIGLFPPAALGAWRFSVVTYGYALGVTWRADEGAPAVRRVVKLGTLPQREEDAALVQWAPDPNVMMGAGTFPPKLEDLLTPPGSDRHLFLRIEEATIAGARRDLRNPEAYRWLADGPLESAVVFAQAFRGTEKVWEGRVAAGESARWDGGEIAIDPRVLLWVNLLAVRDPFLAWAGAGLVLLAAGVLARAGLALRAVAQRARFRASGS